MKKIIRNMAVVMAMGLGAAINPQMASAQDSGNYQQPNDAPPQYGDNNQPQYNNDNNDDVYNQGANDIGGMSYQNYYNQLSPYGRWIYDPTYGYVWMPNAGPGFTPYATAGHWVYTGYGWEWASDYAWGWAPFHYGRWDFNVSLGWYWIPGTVWGPAWVSWRYADGYYGWAPMGPRYGYGYAYPANRWTFCDNRYFGRYDAYRYYSPRGYNDGLFSRSTLVRNTYHDNGRRATYFSGPRRDEVERFTGAQVRSGSINRTNVVRNNYNQHPANYNAQRQSYSAPAQRQNNYNAPRQTYYAPRQGYNAPRQNYSAPRQSASRQSYSYHSSGNAGRSSGGHGGGGGGRRSR